MMNFNDAIQSEIDECREALMLRGYKFHALRDLDTYYILSYYTFDNSQGVSFESIKGNFDNVRAAIFNLKQTPRGERYTKLQALISDEQIKR